MPHPEDQPGYESFHPVTKELLARARSALAESQSQAAELGATIAELFRLRSLVHHHETDGARWRPA